MRKLLFLTLPLTLACAGCVTTALQHHTINQSQSATDYRYRAALHCLAMVAADPGTLPSYSLLTSGVSSVTNTGILSSMTNWKGNPLLYASEIAGATGSHAPQLQWTVSPVAEHTQLEAMRAACRWVLPFIHDDLSPEDMQILADPDANPTPGPHFGVLGRLTHLPAGWLGVGKLCDVPLGALYTDHVRDTWVWVMASGTEGLAGFTLLLQDIATLNVAPSDNSWPANKTRPMLVTLWVTQPLCPPPPQPQVKPEDPTKKQYSPSLLFRVDREIKPEFKEYIEGKIAEGVRGLNNPKVPPVNISWEEWMAMTKPFQGARTAVKPGAPTTTPPITPPTRPYLIRPFPPDSPYEIRPFPGDPKP